MPAFRQRWVPVGDGFAHPARDALGFVDAVRLALGPRVGFHGGVPTPGPGGVRTVALTTSGVGGREGQVGLYEESQTIPGDHPEERFGPCDDEWKLVSRHPLTHARERWRGAARPPRSRP